MLKRTNNQVMPKKLSQGAYDLYQLLLREGATSSDTAKRFKSGEYDKPSWMELSGLKLAANAVRNSAGHTGGVHHVKLYVLKDLPPDLPVGPKQQRARRGSTQRTEGALTIADLRDFADRYEQAHKTLLAERTKQAQKRLQDAQKALVGLPPGKELSDALEAAGRANAAYSQITTSTAVEVLDQLKPAKGSRTYKLWELLASG